MLNFTALNISRISYGKDKGSLSCEVRGESYQTELKIKLPERIALTIMQLISTEVGKAVQEQLASVAADHENWMLSQSVEAVAIEA